MCHVINYFINFCFQLQFNFSFDILTTNFYSDWGLFELWNNFFNYNWWSLNLYNLLLFYFSICLLWLGHLWNLLINLIVLILRYLWITLLLLELLILLIWFLRIILNRFNRYFFFLFLNRQFFLNLQTR